MNRKRTNIIKALAGAIYWDKVLVAVCYFTAGILASEAYNLWDTEPGTSFLLYIAAIISATGGAINQ